MHKIDHAKLAAAVARTACRADFVMQDEAVLKAGQQALHDVRQAVKSIATAANEGHSAWVRSALL